jgi:hypothetical protein
VKHTNRINTSLLFVALLFGITLPLFALADVVNVNIVTDAADTFWQVFDAKAKLISDANGNPMPPQNVCLNDKSPPNCPQGAMKYGHTSPGDWPTSLKDIPGAKWIWAPNITGKTTPAANAIFTFTHDFYLCRPIKDGTVYIAADDSAKVSINGNSVLNTTSNQLTKKTIAANLLNGILTSGFPPRKNTITIEAKNSYLDWCASKDNYQCNPAGMVFGALFPDDEPSCKGSHGETIPHGQTEHNCPAGKIGSTGLCICGYLQAMNDCVTPPQTCTGYVYTEWSACGKDSIQTRTVTGKSPNGCEGDPADQPLLRQACPYVPQTCTSFNYSEWTQCPRSEKQTRTVLASSPAGCIGGTPVTSQSCIYRPPPVSAGEQCGSVQEGLLASCPAGTSCAGRKTCTVDCPSWDWSGLFCSTTCLVSTDWYCDP